MRWVLAIGMSALAGCGAPSTRDDPIGVAVEAAGAKPVIDYPIDVAPREKVPVSGWQACLAPHGQGFLAAWAEAPLAAAPVVKATFLDADGAPLIASPFVLGAGLFVSEAACAPTGDCLLVWSTLPLEEVAVTEVTKTGASKPFHLAKASRGGLVAYDAEAAAFVVAWQADTPRALHFQNGAPIETTPLQIAPAGSRLDALACSPADGCLVTFWKGDSPGTTSGAIVTANAVTPPFPLGDAPILGLTWDSGVYFAVAQIEEGFGFLRLGADGVALDPTPRLLSFPELPLMLAGQGFDGDVFTVLTWDGSIEKPVGSAARVLADGTPATPAGFKLDGFGQQFALACGDGGCAVLRESDVYDNGVLSAVPIAHGAPGAPRAVGEELDAQDLGAACSFGDSVFVAWNEGSVVRSRWFAADATAKSPVIDLGSARWVDAGTAEPDAALLVVSRDDGSLSTRVVSSDGVSSEREITPPSTTDHTAARFAWVDDTALDQSLTLRRFDAGGRALDADPIQIIGPQVAHSFAFGDVARSGDVFAVVAETTKSREISVTRVRDTGEIIDQVPLARGSFGGIACSPTECLISEGRGLGPKNTQPNEVRLDRFSSHADTLAFDVSTLGLGLPGQVAWDGAHFVASYAHDDELHVARIDDDGPAIGTRQLEDDSPLLLAPVAGGRALLFSEAQRGTRNRPVQIADVSVVLVDGFPSGPPPGDAASVVAEGGGCALASTGRSSSDRETLPSAALLGVAAALLGCARLRLRRRPDGRRHLDLAGARASLPLTRRRDRRRCGRRR